MRTRVTHCWRPLAILLGVGLLGGGAGAQLDVNLGSLDEENAEGYLMPLPSALASSLGSGTFRTGHIPQEGFHISIGVEAMSVGFDDEDRTFLPADPPGFTSTEAKRVPTVIGDTQSVMVPGEAGTQRPYPGGFDMEYFVVGAPELRVGCFQGTRGILRYLAIDLGDADLGDLTLFGIGAEHSISQYFPSLPFDLAGGVMYQSLSMGDVLDSDFFQVRFTGSRMFPPLEPYVGLGWDSFGLTGEYTYEGEGEDEEIDLEFDRENSIHLVLGVNLRLSGLTVHSEYNLAAESGVTVGVSFGM